MVLVGFKLSKAFTYITKVKGQTFTDTLTIMIAKSSFTFLRNFLKLVMGKEKAYKWLYAKDLSYINFMLKDVTIKTSSGVIFFCRKKKGDLNVVGEHYEADQMDVHFQPKPKEIVIDIGANVGKYALLACKKVGEEGLVFAIDPDSDCVKIIEKNQLLNKFKNLITLEVAMGEKDGHVEFYQSFDGSRHSTTWIPPHEAKTIKVNQLTLDTLMKKYDLKKIDWLKIDAEGAEYDIFVGGKEALKNTNNILLEIHTKELEKKCISELKEFGFQMKEIARETEDRSWWFVKK